MEKKLTDFTDVELKAIAYEHTKDLQNLSRTLQVIENELASRAKKAQEDKKMEETTNDVVVEEVQTTEEVAETTE